MATGPSQSEPVYVPALKWKGGEQVALGDLSVPVGDSIIPLIELVPAETPLYTRAMRENNEQPRQAKPADAKCIEDTTAIQARWPNRLFYLDPLLPTVRSNNCAIWKLAMDTAHGLGLFHIPVVHFGMPPRCVAEAGAAINQAGRGVAIRVEIPDNITHVIGVIQANIEALGVAANDVDLILDGRNLSMTARSAAFRLNVPTLVADARTVINPRNIIVLAGSMPDFLTNQPFGRSPLARFEWQEYERWRVPGADQIAPIYGFGDYAINSADYSHSPASGPCNIRYCTDAVHDISKEPYATNPSPWHQMARNLMNDPIYRGNGYSVGDQYVADVAGRTTNPGNHMKWRTAGTSHHITYIVEQLRNVGGPSCAVLRVP